MAARHTLTLQPDRAPSQIVWSQGETPLRTAPATDTHTHDLIIPFILSIYSQSYRRHWRLFLAILARSLSDPIDDDVIIELIDSAKRSGYMVLLSSIIISRFG